MTVIDLEGGSNCSLRITEQTNRYFTPETLISYTCYHPSSSGSIRLPTCYKHLNTFPVSDNNHADRVAVLSFEFTINFVLFHYVQLIIMWL